MLPPVLLALEAEVQRLPASDVPRALLAYVHSLGVLEEAVPAAMAQHVRLLDQLLRVLWRAMLLRDLLALELVQMLLVLLVAPLAEREVLARLAVETELTPINGALAAVTGEPTVVVLLVALIDQAPQRLSQLSLVSILIHCFTSSRHS